MKTILLSAIAITGTSWTVPTPAVAQSSEKSTIGECSLEAGGVTFNGKCKVVELPNPDEKLPKSILATEAGDGYAFLITSIGGGVERVFWNERRDGSFPTTRLGDAIWLHGCWRSGGPNGQKPFTFCLTYRAMED